MASCTDTLRLNETELMKVLKEKLPDSVKKTQNILVIRDDVLYVWNAEESSIFSLDVGASRGRAGDSVDYQTLLLTDPPTFEVTNLLINETATQVALWGNSGIAVVELPKRWGKDNAFEGGKSVVSCRSHSLDEKYFHCSGVTEVRRARWHPGSRTDSHLLVLTSENTFHLYECEVGGSQNLKKVWNIGPKFSGSPSKIPNFVDLGDAAVDFDFASPTLNPEIDPKEIETHKLNWTLIEWPILALRGNGDVYIVHGNILSANFSKPLVLGPLTMYPRTDDNYGVDSCSIMCIQTTPPIVVIATCTGRIYHCILLREGDEDDEKKTRSEYGSTFSLHTPDEALYVFECVEMELGLFYEDDDKKYSCPIHLHVDRGNKSRYFCSHNAGIHVVSLPMVSQLEEYIGTKDEESGLFLPSLTNESSSQYLVCTRTKHTDDKKATPVLGFGLLHEPCVLVALLHTGTIVSLSVVDLHYLPRIEPPELVVSPSKKISKEAFDVFIASLFKHEMSQPIMKLGSNEEPTPQECLEMLMRATHIFRAEHFVRQDKVRSAIGKRVRTLRALKNHQIRELDSLVETKKQLQESAERLAERYEDIKDKQEELAKRAEEVLRLVNQKQPSMTPAEKEDANKLKKMNDNVQELVQQIEKLKKKSSYQHALMENCTKGEKKKDIVISESRKDTIKSSLEQMRNEISDMFATVESLEEEVY